MLIGLILSLRLFALDPRQPLVQLHHSSWAAKQGVTGTVMALAQTTDGYLWVGTSDGLLRFDGISFVQYEPEFGRLLASSVSALMATPDGGLWVGYLRGGASFLRKGRVTNYSSADNFPVGTVRGFACEPRGVVWAAVVGGLARYEGSHWSRDYRAWSYPRKTAWALLVDTGSRQLF